MQDYSVTLHTSRGNGSNANISGNRLLQGSAVGETCFASILATTFGMHASLMLTRWSTVLHRVFPNQPRTRAVHIFLIGVAVWVFIMLVLGLWYFCHLHVPRLTWMSAGSSKIVPEFDSKTLHYDIFPNITSLPNGRHSELVELQFLPDMQAASEFRFCCDNLSSCRSLKPTANINL